MKALPKTRYVTVAAETWGLIRGAYLSGLSAPTVAARFGVSVTALRKHAAKEGWTKRVFAASTFSGGLFLSYLLVKVVGISSYFPWQIKCISFAVRKMLPTT